MALLEEGPQLPLWWSVKKAVPASSVATRWNDEFCEAISIPWSLLEHWSKYSGEKGPGRNGYIRSVNPLIERAGYPGRIRENAERVEKELISRAQKVRRAIESAKGRKQSELREKRYKLHLTARDMICSHEMVATALEQEKKT